MAAIEGEADVKSGHKPLRNSVTAHLLQNYRVCPYPRVSVIIYRILRVICVGKMLFGYPVAL